MLADLIWRSRGGAKPGLHWRWESVRTRQSEAGDLIESRSSGTRVARRTVIRNYGDESARQAE
jgi:hypothetical protein